MSVLPIGFGSSGGVDTGDIGHSLRFRRSANPYLSRTFGTPTANTSWALSFFSKQTPVGGIQALLSSGYSTVGFNASEQLTLWDSGGGQVANSTALLRDPTGQIHWFIRSNGTNIKGYRNGVEVLSYTGTIPGLNSATVHNFGRFPALSTHHPDGVFSRIAFVDNGGSLTPSDFAYLNTEINEWVTKSQSAVKAVVDAGGTNSFMLDFDNATSLTTLGYDKSSKGNNWTLNNFSLTAGSTYDHMLDVPGNSFATLNPIYPSAANITNGNLTSGTTAVRGTMSALAYDCKWEVTAGGSAVTAGVISGTGTTNTTSVTANKTFAFRLTTAGALDYKNVTDGGSWTSITTGLTGEQYPYGTTQAANWNFGQAPLHASATYQAAAGGYFYDTTSGYKALCQANLPTPAILNPEKHFDVVTRAGTSAAATISSLSMQADLIWIKARTLGAGGNHVIADSVRGIGSSATKELYPNLTNAESGSTNVVTAFSSNGYSLGTDGAYDRFNATGHTYVDWLWKMGGAAVTNTKGSISSQVSANVLAGQSVVTYTGNNVSGHTVGHGLSSSPNLVIIKSRGNTEPWPVYHASAGFGNQLFLNTTAAQVAPANGYVGVVSSTTFSVNGAATNSNVNSLGVQYVALCFHSVPGYSKVGSYTGNGSADGPYVECGFKPKFVLIKRTDGVNQWEIFDTTRDTYNQMQNIMIPSSSAAETSGYFFDATAGGFKPRAGAGYGFNDSGAAYIFYAVADVAGKFALGR